MSTKQHGSWRTWTVTGVLAHALLLGACDGATATPDATTPRALGAIDTVSVPAADSSHTPFLEVAADGALLLSWTERDASGSHVRLARFAGGRWDSTRTVATGRPLFDNWADFPAVLALANGDLVAHWLERDGAGKYAYGVRVVRSRDQGRTWSAPVTPHADGLAAEHGFVSLWDDGDGAVGLTWLDGRKSAMPDSTREMTVRAGRLAPDATAADETVLDARTCDCCQTGTALARSGRIVVYRDRSPDEIRDIAIVRRDSSGWSAPQRVHADEWHMTGCPVNGPQVVAAGDTVTVAWFTGARDTAKVLVATSTDGGRSFGAPVRVDEGAPVGRIALALDAAHVPLVVWLEQRTPTDAAVLVRRVHDGRLGPVASVGGTSGARASGFPRVARMGNHLYLAFTGVQPVQRVRLTRVQLD
ncbi:MAG: glycoside hydrolase [Gemmatimonadetes bacterium]|nr:glycoside hydrolase [Gemmatimonadota bacterium]